MSVFCQVNNAGVNYNLGYHNSVEFAEAVISTNYQGTKNMIKAMIPLMRPSLQGARIVNVSSRLGRVNGRRNVRKLFLSLSLLSLSSVKRNCHENVCAETC